MSLLNETLSWLSDPAHWAGAGGILQRIVEHLGVVLLVIALAAAIALPTGVLVGHIRRGRGFVVAAAAAGRAVPTLGLLTLVGLVLVGLVLGIGLQAPVLALIVLTVPSVLAGAYSGVEAVDETTVDAARAMGMTEWQVLRRVELPLAAPVIVGGLRSATLQVVATATLAAYVADSGLGRFLFTGLKARDYAQMLAGALLVMLLALLLDSVLALTHRLAARTTTPDASSRRSTPTEGSR